MRKFSFYSQNLFSQFLKTFEKTDAVSSTNLPKSINLTLLIIALLGLSIYQLSSSAVFLNSFGSFLNSSISSLVYAPNGWLQTLAFYILSFSIIALAILLQFKTPVRLNLGAIMIALFGFAMFLIGTCPTQYPGQPLIDNIHHWATFSVVILLPVAGFLVAVNFKKWNYRFLYIYTIANSIFQLLFVLIGGYFFTLHYDLFGLFERVLLCNGQMWLTVICLNFLLAEFKYEFPVISRNHILTRPALYFLFYMYGSLLWPLSLTLIK